jgi:hypothetical protein
MWEVFKCCNYRFINALISFQLVYFWCLIFILPVFCLFVLWYWGLNPLCLPSKYSTTWAMPLNLLVQVFVLFCFVFGSTGIWIQGLTLARQALLTTWDTPPAWFCFWNRVFQLPLPGLVLNLWSSCSHLLGSWNNYRCASHLLF